MNRSTPGLPVHHQLPEFTQTHVHRVSDAIQPSHSLPSPSPPALNLSQLQGLFKWVSSSPQVAKVLQSQPQHQFFQSLPGCWSFQHLGPISFRMDWLDLLAVQGTLKSLLQHHGSKASLLWCLALFIVQLSHPYLTTGKTIAWCLGLLFIGSHWRLTDLKPAQPNGASLQHSPLAAGLSCRVWADRAMTSWPPSVLCSCNPFFSTSKCYLILPYPLLSHDHNSGKECCLKRLESARSKSLKIPSTWIQTSECSAVTQVQQSDMVRPLFLSGLPFIFETERDPTESSQGQTPSVPLSWFLFVEKL